MSRHAATLAAFALCSAATVHAQKCENRPAHGQLQPKPEIDDAQSCETRDFTIPAVKALSIDGRQNGGITVHGWDKNEIQVVATIQAHASTDADADALAKQVTVTTTGGEIRATGTEHGPS